MERTTEAPAVGAQIIWQRYWDRAEFRGTVTGHVPEHHAIRVIGEHGGPEEVVHLSNIIGVRCDGCDEIGLALREYEVTHHTHVLRPGDAQKVRAHYCDDCAALAGADWNGTTAAIRLVANGE